MARRIYLDYASTTPVDKRVMKAMMPFFSDHFENPSALYKEALTAKAAANEARKKIADILNIRTEEIIFTASGTESDNMALMGVTRAYQKKFIPHIITTNIEHPGILEACKYLEKNGVEITYVPVEESGIVDPQKIKQALKSTTVLVSVMYANNEIGTIQPLREISRVIANYKSEYKNIHNQAASGYKDLPYFHTDASQAANYLDLSFQKLGVDMMTLDAGKIYGPKGVGLLACKHFVTIEPLLYGGGQEKGLRPGTENVAGIVGMAEALSIAEMLKDEESERLKKLQKYFIENVIKYIPGVIIHGDSEHQLPNTINIGIPHLDAEFAVLQLDSKGIACSAASACRNLTEDSFSYVIEALGETGKQLKRSSLRFTFGRGTTERELDLTLKQLPSIIIRQ